MSDDDHGARPLHRHRFGDALFDEARFELRIGGQVVDAQHKPLALLALLLARHGEVVTKDEIVATLWSGRETPDQVIATTASRLRAALGERHARCVATVPRKGYRFELPPGVELTREAVGRRHTSDFAFEPGIPVPGRESFRLVRRLGPAPGRETWLAQHSRSGEQRVFKFATDGERLADLKREITIARMLLRSLLDGDRVVRIVDWRVDQAPFWTESEWGGPNLLEWADEPSGTSTRLLGASLDERLAIARLIVDVMAAVHAVDVIHKDLKPGNILIEPAADGWRVRVADFGSSRLLDPRRLEALHITRLGMTVASADSKSGTLSYMAPECRRGAPATAASDVYALGIVLYQLVTGDLQRPIGTGWDRDIDDPLLVEDIAAATDLEAARRPATAGELAQRLAMLPVRRAERAARHADAERAEQTALELMRTRARRPWVLAAIVALALGTATSTLLWLGQRRAGAALARQYDLSQALNRLLREDLIGAASPARSGRADVTVADALTVASGRIDEKFADRDAAVRGSLHAALQAALSDLSRVKESVESGRRALSALTVAPHAPPSERQSVRLRLALDLVQLSRLDEARALVAAIEADARHEPAPDATFRVRLLYVKSWVVSGEMAVKEATRLLEEAMRIADAAPTLDPQVRRATAFALADSYTMENRLGEAEVLYRRLLTEHVRTYGSDDARTLFVQVGLGRTLGQEGRLPEARTLLQQAANGLTARLGPGHRQTLDARDQLAQLRFLGGDWAGAAEAWGEVHRGFVALLGEGSGMTLTVLTNLGVATQRAGEPRRAESLLRDALEKARGFLKNDAPQVQQIRFALADCLLDLQRPDDATPLLNGLTPEALNDAQPESDWPRRLEAVRAKLRR